MVLREGVEEDGTSKFGVGGGCEEGDEGGERTAATEGCAKHGGISASKYLCF